jgi:hypothetical protein
VDISQSFPLVPGTISDSFHRLTETSEMIDGNGQADRMNILRLPSYFGNAIQFSKIYRVYSFNLRSFSSEFVVIAPTYFVSLS